MHTYRIHKILIPQDIFKQWKPILISVLYLAQGNSHLYRDSLILYGGEDYSHCCKELVLLEAL